MKVAKKNSECFPLFFYLYSFFCLRQKKEKMFKFLIILIIVLLVLNLYVCSTLLNGNWESTEDFSEKADSKLYLNLQGHFNRNAKLIIIKDEAIVFEGNIFFIGSPHGIFFWRNCGIAICTNFGEGDEENKKSKDKSVKVLPKWLYYSFNPLKGHLTLFRDKVYAEMEKL